MKDDIWLFKKQRNDECFIQFSSKVSKTPDLLASPSEIHYPCDLYAIHRVDGITEGTSNEYIKWKYDNVTANGGSSGCSQLSKLMKGAVDCDVNHDHVVMYVIIAIEGIVIFGIAVAFVVVMVRKFWKSRSTKLAASTAKTEPKTDAKSATKTPVTVTDKPATEKAKLN
uniref:IGv domain-containing protein n=1 Tax=Panagrellus redivivus TaxID=6233 RepID=A0A7E4VDP6_PANRE